MNLTKVDSNGKSLPKKKKKGKKISIARKVYIALSNGNFFNFSKYKRNIRLSKKGNISQVPPLLAIHATFRD